MTKLKEIDTFIIIFIHLNLPLSLANGRNRPKAISKNIKDRSTAEVRENFNLGATDGGPNVMSVAHALILMACDTSHLLRT